MQKTIICSVVLSLCEMFTICKMVKTYKYNFDTFEKFNDWKIKKHPCGIILYSEWLLEHHISLSWLGCCIVASCGVVLFPSLNLSLWKWGKIRGWGVTRILRCTGMWVAFSEEIPTKHGSHWTYIFRKIPQNGYLFLPKWPLNWVGILRLEWHTHVQTTSEYCPPK